MKNNEVELISQYSASLLVARVEVGAQSVCVPYLACFGSCPPTPACTPAGSYHGRIESEIDKRVSIKVY